MESRMKKVFEASGLRWSRTRERGATAVVIALCLLLLVTAAAMSFDTANLALERQTLRNITDAAAQAGATYLPDSPADASLAVDEYAKRYDPNLTLQKTFWCIVASTGATKQVPSGALYPTTCDPNPGVAVTYKAGSNNVVCDEYLCAIPCDPIKTPTARCNSMQVTGSKDVKFNFAPAIGIPSWNTGSITSVSCAKSCGSGGKPNPANIAIVADRTPSMLQAQVMVNGKSESAFAAMQTSIENSLETLTPELQFVSLGTIHKSKFPTTNSCLTLLPGPNAAGTKGTWMPLTFSNNYLTGNIDSPAGTRTLDTTKPKLGYQVECMNSSDNAPWNTHLAAPLKAAARVLLGKAGTNSGITAAMNSSRDLLTDNATPNKWIIFETDGQPVETMAASNDTSLDDAVDPSAPWDAGQACTNLKAVATEAKDAGIHIIMIAFGSGTTTRCGNQGTVRDVMAAAASPRNFNPATPSTAPTNCTTANSDGDFFFCATTGDELSTIFATALGQASSSTTRFVKLPM